MDGFKNDVQLNNIRKPREGISLVAPYIAGVQEGRVHSVNGREDGAANRGWLIVYMYM